MIHRAIDQVMERVEDARSESDFNQFFSLLLAGEALFKTVTLGMIAAIADDKDRNRYRLEHTLARAVGLGDWGRVLEDAVTGPASQYLLANAHPELVELTKNCNSGDWQHDAVSMLKSALDSIGVEAEEVPARTDFKRWFRLFVTLRNKTRGHGGLSPSVASRGNADLQRSIECIHRHASLLRRPWADIYRNNSGKYRVSPISADITPFECLRKEPNHTLANGVYIHFGALRKVPLLCAGPELRDFFFANGGFGGKRFEMLSFCSGDKIDGNAAEYVIPPGVLPASETEGHGELMLRGNCLSNVPDMIDDYIDRPALERELNWLLSDDRRPIVTLLGRGGIGKTSLSIKVIEGLFETSRFDVIVWFSSRDVDLQLSGPKPVRPLVVSPDEMGKLYAKLVLSDEQAKTKGFNARRFLEQQLEKHDLGSCLFVFDNFETTQNPIDAFGWIDTFIRLPNKALITTRLRDFKGDYPLEVSGMEESEARSLIAQTAGALEIKAILNQPYIEELIRSSGGHPYVIKILLGELARSGRPLNIDQMVAGNDELLTALFERTYASLTPCAQRAFLTLSAWASSVPRIALEAVLMRSTFERQEVERGVETLVQFSMAELHMAPADRQVFIRLPLVASVFGKKKLGVSPLRAAIQADVEILQMLGPSRSDDLQLGLANRLRRLIENVARRVDAGQSFDDYAPIVEMICRAYNPGWLMLARWHLESELHEDIELAKNELKRFLEQQPPELDAAEAWRLLGLAYFQTGDKLGAIHAFIERAQLSAVDLFDISNTANRLNGLLRDHGLDVEKEEKVQLAQRLLAVLQSRRSEASPDDFSRMAWLALHTGRQSQAAEFAQAGLALDPENFHCRGIADRLRLVPLQN